jgi:DNA-binding transcriptional ArsR family regulator
MSDVFTAVADTTRRGILERLRREGALSIAELSEGLPITRQAVTKHLGILADAGLIERSRSGRERLHRLSGEPLKEVSDWLVPYEAEWDARLERLKKHVDGPRARKRP